MSGDIAAVKEARAIIMMARIRLFRLDKEEHMATRPRTVVEPGAV